MTLDLIKSFKTNEAWEEIAEHIPEAKAFANKASFGKKMGLEILKAGYQAGIRDAQQDNLAASRS